MCLAVCALESCQHSFHGGLFQPHQGSISIGVGPTAQLVPAQHGGVECLQLLTQHRKESQSRTVLGIGPHRPEISK
jgi:hypothetical protein